MKNLDEVINILLQFKEKLKKKQSFYASMRALNPNFGPLSEDNCQKEIARYWIYGTDDIGALWKAPLPKIPYQTEASKSLASKHYKNWQKVIEANAAPDSDYYGYFLNAEEFIDYHLDEPKSGETLYGYIIRLQDIVENKEKIHFLWERGLSGFLHHLRKTISKDQIAFLELIFPEDMEIRKITAFKEVKIGKKTSGLREVPYGQIARKISPAVYSINIKTAADIICELANTVLHGRQNAKLVAAETLGLCWICLTSSRLRLPISLKDLFVLPKDVLRRSVDDIFPTLSLPTIFSYLPMPVSGTIWGLLKALSNTPGGQPRSSIFQSPEESLYRRLRHTLEKLDLDPTKGKITFQTFLSPPVEFDHRFQPK